MAAGVDVFRLNASHGTQTADGRANPRRRGLWRLKPGAMPAILLDLQGPKIRLGQFEKENCEIPTGGEFTITVEKVLGNAQRASTGFAAFASEVKPGARVLLADGAVVLEALESDGVAVRCRVISGGMVGSNKGINLPGVALNVESVTPKDLADLQFGLEAGVDLVALSFVRRADDVTRLREHLGGRSVPVIAKIEKPEAWEHIDEILDDADGVMVARGDLGVEMALERVPPMQKAIIAPCPQTGEVRNHRHADAGIHD